MKVIDSSWGFEVMPGNPAQVVEKIGRTCYKSEASITPTSAPAFVRMLRDRGHFAMFDHVSATVRVICDRGISHELVRHRIAAYAQESTRYCNYAKGKFGGELTFILPDFWNCIEHDDSFLQAQLSIWLKQMQDVENAYLALIAAGAPPEQARVVLPISVKTEIIMTLDFTSWRNFFRLRAAKAAHPQMRVLARSMLTSFIANWPEFFDDITF